MFFHVLLLWLSFSPASAAYDALPGCPEKCGKITIPYPFGTHAGCYLNPDFRITCNTTYKTPKAFINTTEIEITKISIDGTMIIRGGVARDCYKLFSDRPNINSAQLEVTGLPYTFSYTRNKFTALGCDTLAMNYGENYNDYSSGCASFCQDPSNIVNGSCSGIGCCQTAIPKGLKAVYTLLSTAQKHTTTWNFSPCSYAFLVDQDQYTFNIADFYGFYKKKKVPVVMDWAIGNTTCEAAYATRNLACGVNSYCTNSTNGRGYRCSCEKGYKGNPYLISNGCQDINECEDSVTNSCTHTCDNTPGSYACSCPHGYYGDGEKDGKGCTKQNKKFPLLQVILGFGLGCFFLLVIGSWIYWGLKQQNIMKQKELFFKQNRGLLLQQKISSREGSTETARIFTAEELAKATDNYSESRILGRGGHGIVYKGILSNNRVVAIKKSHIIDESEIEQFVNEVVILSQVIHKNVVRILGCCLETQVPLLVYEYVSNGTLFHHIHKEGYGSPLSWETRLRIATDTAGALAYLHSAASQPIFHRDVKSSNILLDNNYMSKVSDFGASRLIPLDRAEVTTLVQGTLGYLDPEYFQTGQLTEKSDVYSFGIVMTELLTGQMPICYERPEEEQNLAMYFLINIKLNRFFEILDPLVRNEGNHEQLLEIAEVTKKCLRLKGEERPTMKEVAAELEQSTRQVRHPWVELDHKEDENLLDSSAATYYTSHVTTGHESLNSNLTLSVQIQR